MRRGLAPTRADAQAAILEGRILVGGAPAAKPARLVSSAEAVVVSGRPARFVSRGGEKLDAALARFDVPVAGRRALDAGASTGGFTDCLLQRGASSVTAVDVGHGQLHPRLRSDRRVIVLERTNIRSLTLDAIAAPPFPLVVADLSFISLRTVAPQLLGRLAAPEADVVVLIKPQFEAGVREASRGRGVIRDPMVWRRVLEEVSGGLAAAGAAMMGVMVSPLTGASGNVEFLAHVRAHTAVGPVLDLDVVLAEAQAR